MGSEIIAERTKRLLESQSWLMADAPVALSFMTAIATYPDEAVTADQLLRLVEQRMTEASGGQKGKSLTQGDRPMAQGKKILVADDEQELVSAITTRLAASGYEVLTARDGAQALELAIREKPDLILLDVLMPIMDGYACLRQLNAKLGRGKIPVMVLTSRDYMKDLFALEGVEDYVIKPFDGDELLERIERILKRGAKSP